MPGNKTERVEVRMTAEEKRSRELEAQNRGISLAEVLRSPLASITDYSFEIREAFGNATARIHAAETEDEWVKACNRRVDILQGFGLTAREVHSLINKADFPGEPRSYLSPAQYQMHLHAEARNHAWQTYFEEH